MEKRPTKIIQLENTEDNHQKVWICELYENKIITRWGKIGTELSSKEFPGEGIDFLNKKVRSKLKKGYVEV